MNLFNHLQPPAQLLLKPIVPVNSLTFMQTHGHYINNYEHNNTKLENEQLEHTTVKKTSTKNTDNKNSTFVYTPPNNNPVQYR